MLVPVPVKQLWMTLENVLVPNHNETKQIDHNYSDILQQCYLGIEDVFYVQYLQNLQQPEIEMLSLKAMVTMTELDCSLDSNN